MGDKNGKGLEDYKSTDELERKTVGGKDVPSKPSKN